MKKVLLGMTAVLAMGMVGCGENSSQDMGNTPTVITPEPQPAKPGPDPGKPEQKLNMSKMMEEALSTENCVTDFESEWIQGISTQSVNDKFQVTLRLYKNRAYELLVTGKHMRFGNESQSNRYKYSGWFQDGVMIMLRDGEQALAQVTEYRNDWWPLITLKFLKQDDLNRDLPKDMSVLLMADDICKGKKK